MMELDDFKELWNKDTGQDPPEISLIHSIRYALRYRC